MRITARVTIIMLLLCCAFGAVAVISYLHLPAGQSDSSLFSALVEVGSMLMGAVLALAMLAIEHQLQENDRIEAKARHRHLLAGRVQWALRKLAVEIIEAVEATGQLVANPTLWNLTNLADDSWVTSRKMLADNLHCGPAHYALTDFYKRLRVLQMADSKRLDYLLANGQRGEAKAGAIIGTQADLVLEAGRATLALLREQGQDVAQRIDERLAAGPEFSRIRTDHVQLDDEQAAA